MCPKPAFRTANMCGLIPLDMCRYVRLGEGSLSLHIFRYVRVAEAERHRGLVAEWAVRSVDGFV